LRFLAKSKVLREAERRLKVLKGHLEGHLEGGSVSNVDPRVAIVDLCAAMVELVDVFLLLLKEG
jgi:hypothetical protein